MDQEAVLQEFKEAGAVLKGHFVLTSGLHTDTYLQCARVMMSPTRAEKLCTILATKVQEILNGNIIDMVVSPAMGGVVVGYEMGRQLASPAIFCERVDGTFTLRRGFEIAENARILLVEDVVTTGKSSLETVECIKNHGGNVVAEACLINRSGKNNPLGDIPLVALAELEIQTYNDDEVPSALAEIPITKPGSRFIKS